MFDMWLLMPIRTVFGQRVMWARHATGGLYTPKAAVGQMA
jgi:hypothetical protein